MTTSNLTFLKGADLWESGIALLPPNPRVVISGNHATPWSVWNAFDKSLETYILHQLNAPAGLQLREDVTPESCFTGSGFRKHPRFRYIPMRLSMVPLLFINKTLPVDVVIAHVSEPWNGKVSLGAETNIMVGAIEACKANGGLVIGQVNKQMPYCFGDAEQLTDIFDILIETDEPIGNHAPWALPDVHVPHGAIPDAPASGKIDPVESANVIAELVSARIKDNSTLQLGIGAIPDLVLQQVKTRKNIGIWSEMFADGLLDLHEAGCLDPQRYVTASFMMGSRELFEFVDKNPMIRMMRTEVTNRPGLIANNPMMTSINTALQIDLWDRANAGRIGKRILSGFGGSTDFIVGAIHSPGGQALMALRSWHVKADVSTIVPELETPTTSYMHSAVITENGVAEILGHTQNQIAANLIKYAAHPSVRTELYESGKELGLI